MFKGLGNIGNIASMIGTLQKMPEKLQELNERMKRETVSASSGCGKVVVSMNGVGHVDSVKIGGELAGHELEQAVLEATNAAGAAAKALYAEAIREMVHEMDLNVPGIDGLLTNLTELVEAMGEHAGAVSELVEQLGRLPGIGRKSAERLAFHLLRVSEQEALALAESIRRVRQDVRYCATCFNLSESEACAICCDPSRDTTRLCVVEQPRDLMSLEQSGVFKGLYHVLLGRIAPLDGIGPDQLTIDPLVDRVRTGNFVEVIMATNPTVEGDGTSLYISNLLSEFPVEITRLARGITAGSVLEYANREMIADALTGRQKL